MIRILARRLATGIATLLVVTLLVFLLIQLSAGSPLGAAEDAAGFDRWTPEMQAQLERLYRLDQPIYRQYLLWLGDAIRGDLGRSTYDRRPVSQKIAERAGITIALNALALALTVLIAVPLGTAAAVRPNSLLDRASAITTYLLYSLPLFWAALLLQVVFSVELRWLPSYGLRSLDHALRSPAGRGLDLAAHLILPVLCLTYGGLAYVSRFVRATLLDQSGEGHRAARARGLSEWAVVYRHGFRQAAIPMLTLAGFLLPGVVGGSVIVETIFALPGLGELFVLAVFQRDLPVLMGLTLLSGAATLAGIVLADASYAIADPRVRRA